MKILHIITSLRTGGAEKLMIDLIPRLKNKNHEVDLMLFDGIETPLKKLALEHRINIINLDMGCSVYSPKFIFKMIPFLKNYDIIHTHNYTPQLFSVIANQFIRKPLVTTEHNTTNRRRNWKFLSILDKWMYKDYKKIICISPQTEKNLRAHINNKSDKILTIFNGIDTKKFFLTPSKKDLNKNPNEISLVQIAAFRDQKDQDTSIKSLLYLPDNFHLYLVGEGKRKNILKDLSTNLKLSDRVHFLGIRTDIPEILNQADFVLVSSHWEGFGLAAVEGMAAGKPVFASDVDGLKQIVENNGVIFEHQNPENLALKILDLHNNPIKYHDICDKAKIKSLDYDIERMAERYHKVYTDLISY